MVIHFFQSKVQSPSSSPRDPVWSSLLLCISLLLPTPPSSWLLSCCFRHCRLFLGPLWWCCSIPATSHAPENGVGDLLTAFKSAAVTSSLRSTPKPCLTLPYPSTPDPSDPVLLFFSFLNSSLPLTCYVTCLFIIYTVYYLSFATRV